MVLGHSAACYVLTALSVEHDDLPSPQFYGFICPGTAPDYPRYTCNKQALCLQIVLIAAVVPSI